MKMYQIVLKDGSHFVIDKVHSVAIVDGSYSFYTVGYELLFAVPFDKVSYVINFDLVTQLNEPVKAEGSE